MTLYGGAAWCFGDFYGDVYGNLMMTCGDLMGSDEVLMENNKMELTCVNIFGVNEDCKVVCHS